MPIKKGKLSINIIYDDNTKVKILIDSTDLSHSVETLLDLLNNKNLSNKVHSKIFESDNSPGKEGPDKVEFLHDDSTLKIRKTEEDSYSIPSQEDPSYPNNVFSQEDKKERTRVNDILVLFRSLPPGWFSSKEIQKLFNERFGENLKLSEVSIYLSRLASRGFLQRVKAGRYFKYKLGEVIAAK
ncbi:MAG: hypothetical protein QW768_00055 [Thermoproteota archaeon]